MKGIDEIIKKKQEEKTSKNIGERHLIVGDIAKKLNETSYKKLSMSLLGKLLSRFPTSKLYSLHKECIDGKNYAALFWWNVKKK